MTAKHARCFAIRRVIVSKGTPGAQLVPGLSLPHPKGTVGPAGGMTPADLWSAYTFSSTATGTGQVVAIVDAYNDPNIQADLGVFDTQYGLTTCTTANGCLKVVNQSGATSPLPGNDPSGWSGEEALDVETVHAVCQNCKIVLLEANNDSNTDLEAAETAAANTIKANEISNSWGEPETNFSSTEAAVFKHPGIVITASTGDDGYYAYDGLTPTNQPDVPAALNTVIGVGGTSLFLSQTGTRQAEGVWNDNGPNAAYEANLGFALGATGGGCSTMTSAQPWQTAVTNWSQTVCGTKRLATDVSAVGDWATGLDMYSSYDCGSSCQPVGWSTAGGTSLSSPIIAGMFALAGGAHGVAYPALTLYGHLGTGSLYDVAFGGNGWCDGMGAPQCADPNLSGFGVVDCDYPASGTTPSAGNRACDAQAGYDGASGVGAPTGLTAFAKTGPKATINGPTAVAVGAQGTWSLTKVSDPFPKGTVTKFSWVWGDGVTTTTTTAVSESHTYSTGGSYTIKLNLTDNYGQTATISYPITVS